VRVGPHEASLGQALKDGGYTTFFCGKWHLGGGADTPDHHGFDFNIAGGAAGATRSHFAPYTVSRRATQETGALVLGLDDAPKDEYLADRLTTETVKFLRGHTNQPFFAVLAHYAVHTPIEGRQAYAARYQQKLKKNPPPRGPAWEKESAGQNKLKQDHPVYAAMIQSVDEGVGKILNTLDELGIADHTIVVLTSDNGGLSSRGGSREMATSNRPLRAGKGHIYEGGIRLPLIVRWPGVTQPGRVTDVPVIGTDYYPTFLEIAGLRLRPTQHLDGTSFVGVLKGTAPKGERALFWHNPAPRPGSTADLFSSAIREGNFKLIDFYVEKRVELYDLSSDLGERHNLMDAMPSKGKELLDKLNAWRSEVNAAMPTSTPRARQTRNRG
jgi:arylsulfatase A-like enzyme